MSFKYLMKGLLIYWLTFFSFVFAFQSSGWFFIPAIFFLIYSIIHIISIFGQSFISGNNKVLNIFEGGLGCGKTFLAVSSGVARAKTAWFVLKIEKFFIKRKIRKIEKKNKKLEKKYQKEEKKLRRYPDGHVSKRTRTCPTFRLNDKLDILNYTLIEIETSQFFYKTHPELIPLLWSNVPIHYKGMSSNLLVYEHFTQQEFLPYRSVVIIDEASSVFPIDSYTQRAESPELNKISNFFERFRHYVNGQIFITCQDGDNIYKDIKRLSVSYVKLNKSPFWGRLFGVRVIKYKDTDRTGDGEIVVRTKEDDGFRHLIVSSKQRGQYNDRCFRKLYLSKDKTSLVSYQHSLLVAPTENNYRLFSRKIKKEVKADRN